MLKPEKKKNIDLSILIGYAEDYLARYDSQKSYDDNPEGEDLEYLYEELMIQVYGEGVFDYINAKQDEYE